MFMRACPAGHVRRIRRSSATYVRASFVRMSSRSNRGREIHNNLSATRSLLSEAVRHLASLSAETTTRSLHGGSISTLSPNGGSSGQLTHQESRNVEVQRDTGAHLGCSRWFDRPATSVPYPYRPFSSRGLSLKRANVQGISRSRPKKKR